MGMYTELVLSTRVKPIESVIDVLQYMAGKKDKPVLPNHPLFKTTRWDRLFASCSSYFVPRSVCLLEYDEIGGYWVLILRADLKNYEGEIEKFIDWIDPYLDLLPGELVGYSRYEETNEPTLIYKK